MEDLLENTKKLLENANRMTREQRLNATFEISQIDGLAAKIRVSSGHPDLTVKLFKDFKRYAIKEKVFKDGK